MPDSLYGHYEPGKDLVLASLSWPELAEMREQVELVLLPVGSNEQHGPNIALSMDISGAYEFCRRASEMAYPRLMVAPPMPWGVSFHHMNFPGTITLSPDTFARSWSKSSNRLASTASAAS
jgi:creatinine amidohydrolase